MLNAELTPEIAGTGVEVQGSQAVICTVIWVYGLEASGNLAKGFRYSGLGCESYRFVDGTRRFCCSCFIAIDVLAECVSGLTIAKCPFPARRGEQLSAPSA